MKISANRYIKGISSIQYESGTIKRTTKDKSDISEVNNIVIACKRSRFSDAFFIHLYCKKTRQQNEKITIKKTVVLNKYEDKTLLASTDAAIITNITVMVMMLARNKANRNVLLPLDLIFDRVSINEKTNGVIISFIKEKIMFNLLKI